MSYSHPPPGPGGYQQGQPEGYPPQYNQQAHQQAPSKGQEPGQTDPARASEAPDDVEDFQPSDASNLQKYEGYGDVGFNQGASIPPPPTYEESVAPPIEGQHMEFGSAARISEEEAREALLAFVAENCCYGKGAAEKMIMNLIVPSNALHYTLETFCEARNTGRVEIPYFGDAVDGPFNGPPPMPWSIPCSPSQQFVRQVCKIPVPHTEEVRTCGRCRGCGFVRCGRCRGSGRNRCGSCSGKGSRRRRRGDEWVDETCHSCHGSGQRRCMTCGGDGRVRCPHCRGTGRVKNYIQLTVTYENHVTDYIMEETGMPDELVRDVAGVQLFQQIQPQVWPISAFPVQDVNDASSRLVDNAKHSHPTELQLNQRQTLRAVPITEIQYLFKDVSSRFWVYGMERKVYSPDYPQQCCWGCNIL